ncbi:MAG: adenosine kinase [Candidatus Aenigmarchaeota archaeon]|nr:adenosine kinase [Candidatus Aenigmarchaeota archaeon]
MAFDVFGFGNTLVDIVMKVDDSHVMELDLRKGTFHLVGEDKIRGVLEKFQNHRKTTVPAGSAANTVFALSSLGADTVLCGKIGNDPHGDLYEEIVIRDRITSRIKRTSDGMTGTVINLVTPDGERTFVVNLGAAVTLRKEDLSDVEEDLSNSKIFHTEGYVLAHDVLRESAMHLLETAKKSGVKISIDLSDSMLIKNNLEFLTDVVTKYADIAFFNEEEAKAFTGLEPEEAVDKISGMCEIAIVKLGSEGSLIRPRNGKLIRIGTKKVEPVDTTGAGDFYAAGFLYGLSRGKDLRTCGNIGSIIAGNVVRQIGARPPGNMRELPELKGLL